LEDPVSLIEVAFAGLLIASQLFYLVVIPTLGVRLLLLAKRSRKQPEALLAVHFLLCCGLGYVLLITGLTGANDPTLMSASAVTALISIGYLASAIGVFAEAGFNFLVFRRNDGWAKGLMALFGATLGAGYIGYGLTGGFQTGAFAGVWLWLLYGSFIAVAAWVMIEPLVYHHRMKKRLQLGLAEPMVVNRFLLWGVGSILRFAMVVGGIIPSVIFEGQRAQLRPDAIGWTLMAVALAGVGVAVSYSLTFFPTPRYVRFVERRSDRAPEVQLIDPADPQ
jgi:hypothetical protein